MKLFASARPTRLADVLGSSSEVVGFRARSRGQLDLPRDVLCISFVKSTYSVTAAQAQFPAVIRAAQNGRLVAVSKHNETVAFVVSRERMEAIAETMELLADRDFMSALQAERAGKGKLYPASSLAD